MNERFTPDTSASDNSFNDAIFRTLSPEDIREENGEIVADYAAELHKLEPVVEDLVMQLAEGIAKSRWDAIVGDDVRGRVVTLIIGKVARQHAENSEQTIPKRLFIATGKHEMEDRWPAIDSYIQHIHDWLGSRVLFTTEYIESGETVRHTIQAFQRTGITCDVASTYMMGGNNEDSRTQKFAEELRKEIPKWHGALYVGEEVGSAPTIDHHLFKSYDVMGVEKALGATTVSSARLKMANAHADGINAQEIADLKMHAGLHQTTVIKPIREEIKSISDRIYAHVFGTM